MTRSIKLVVGVIIVLTVLVVVFALLNQAYIAPKREALDNSIFFLYAGNEKYTVSMDDVESLPTSDIEANYKKSGQSPESRTYRGVSLKALVESLGVDASAYHTVSFTAADGYASALAIDEAMDDGNCYIVIEMGGEPLGTNEDGGSGPFMMILAHDTFSQRWCKFLLEVRLR